MNYSEFDEKFDNREDITKLLDLKKAKRSSQVQKSINVDMQRCTFDITLDNPRQCTRGSANAGNHADSK